MVDYPMVKVYALGMFKVEMGNEQLNCEGWKSKKALKLFKYLLVNYDQTCSVDKIVDKLWPDCNLKCGKQRLYDTVYQLRREIDSKNQETSYVQNEAQGYSLNLGDNYWFDWQQLAEVHNRYNNKRNLEELSSEEAKTGIEQLKAAIDLYNGEFMGQELYADWVEVHRVRYRQILLDLIMIISRLLSRFDRNKEALDYLEYGISEEPFREDFYLWALKILNKENRIWEQAILYKKYTEILENELGIPPSKAVQKEFDKLKEKTVLTVEKTVDSFEINIDDELELMKIDSDSSGALECDFKTFKEIYKLKQRQAARTGQPSTLLRISFDRIFDVESLNKYLAKVRKKLRGIDVITKYSSNLFVLLPGAPLESNLIIAQRILGTTPLRELGANPQIKWEEISTPAEEELSCSNLLAAEEQNNSE